MIRVISFATPKKNGNTNNGNSSNSTNNTTITTGVDGVNIWGQYHDHTRDITGNMSGVGSITASGNINTSGNLISNKVITGDINSSGNLTTNNITANGTINATGNITTDGSIYAENAYITNEIVADSISADDGDITNLISSTILCENLTVTKAAHFFKLVIDEIKATKGQILVTPANATVDKVTFANNRYTLYFRATDADGKKIHNMFEVDDQVVCQTFDAATGTNYNVANKFYWSKVVLVSSTPTNVEIDGQTVPCHSITLDWSDKDTNTNGVPQAGDEVVMLGNRTDATRQNAISIGAYNNPYLDSTIQAPFIVQYAGINDYNLSNHRKNVISNGLNTFSGTFTTTTGDNIEDLIDDVSQGALTYMHVAYANSANGQTNFSKTYFDNALYIGFCSNHTQSDASLRYSDYTWCRLRGQNGQSASSYQLIPETLSIHVDGNNATSESDFYVRGYEFESTGITEINNACQYTYIYENPSFNYTQTQDLPILISPQQDTQSFELGLQKIQFKMYDESESEFVAINEVPIIRDGADLEEYKLIPVQEQVPIDKNGTVGINLQYNIMHIVGGNYQNVTATSTMCVYFKAIFEHTNSNYTALSTGTTLPTYQNARVQTNYNTSDNKLLYLQVVLANGTPNTATKIYDSRVVYASMLASATFEITDEIKSTVQGHTTQLNGITNSISTINQRFDQISSTVQSNTTAINTLTGRVTTNETNISNITQKADSIESTVKNLKTGQRNLFNFTNCHWLNVVPFIKGYGVECKNSGLNRVTNLGFDGIGGDFAVTCLMKMQTNAATVSVNICDTNDAGNETVNVTTEWQEYQFIFKGVTRFIGNAQDTSNYNGFIDFESNAITNTNRLYVRELMVVRGNVPTNFAPSWKDYEFANTNNLFALDYSEHIAQTTDTYKGYPVYSPTWYSTDEAVSTDYIFANNKNLKTNTPYTLSFYAKADYNCVIEQYLYGNGGCVDGTVQVINSVAKAGDISISNFADGNTRCYVGTNWKQYIIHWYNQNSGNRSIIAYRDNVNDWDTSIEDGETPNLQIAGVEFKEGYWDVNLLNSQSLIRQTANEIELKVANTGININDGTITLTAENTIINGNLNLHDPKQGLIIYDQYNNPKITIQNETIGTLDDFDFGADKLFSESSQSEVTTQAYNVTFNTITLGNFKAGQKLDLYGFILDSYNVNYAFATTFNRIAYSFIIKCNNSTVTSKNGNATKESVYYTIPDFTIASLPANGTYTIQFSFSGNLTSTQLYGNFNHSIKFYARTIQTSINKVATDGAVFASSTEDFNWMGSDQTMLRNGDSAIRLKDGHIERNVYNAINPYYSNIFCDISSTVPYALVNTLTYTATLNDGLIVFSSVIGRNDNDLRTLYLPNPSTCAGKFYYVKNMVGDSTSVQVTNAGTQNYFIEQASTTHSTSNEVSCEYHSIIFISIGMYWLSFFCG